MRNSFQLEAVAIILSLGHSPDCALKTYSTQSVITLVRLLCGVGGGSELQPEHCALKNVPMNLARHWVIKKLAVGCTAVLVASCATVRPPPALSEDPNIRPVNASPNAAAMGVDPYIAFNRALLLAQDSKATVDNQIEFLNEGFALIDSQCSAYFAILGKAEQNLRFARNQTTLTSGVALSLLGLANASTNAVATVGTLFSFGVASMNTYEDVYIFSPDVMAVQALVHSAMGSYKVEFAKQAGQQPVMSYTFVESQLRKYASYCEPHGIRHLVNQSLAQVQTTAGPQANAGGSVGVPAVPVAGGPARAPAAVGNGLLQKQIINAMPAIDVRVIPR